MIQVKAYRSVRNTKVFLNNSSPRICQVTITPKTVNLKYQRVDLENIIFDGENVIYDGEQVKI